MKGARLLIALSALLALFSVSAHAQTSEDEVKATFVYRFVSFVSWPPHTGLDRPVLLCVAGADPFARILMRIVRGERAGARAFQVRAIAAAGDIDGCDALYVVGERTEIMLRTARSRPVLTITDALGGGQRGIIHFVVVEDRVRFYIDDASAAESGLTIDPRLLNLALAVRRRS